MDQNANHRDGAPATPDGFQTMLNLEVEPADSYNRAGEAESDDGWSPPVGIAEKWTGTGCVYCTSELALRTTSTMFMVEVNSVNLEVLEAISGHANMIAGSLRSMLGSERMEVKTCLIESNLNTSSTRIASARHIG